MFASSSFLGLAGGRAEIRDIRAALLVPSKDSGMGHGNASSLVVDPSYRRDPPCSRRPRSWRIRKRGSSPIFGIAGALGGGLIDAELLVQLYLNQCRRPALNSLRTLAAHRYRSEGDPMTATQQLLDSLNYPRRSWLIPLWAPVGLRFHALHHLFPSIPYHNLAAAHDRLTGMLPQGSPYHRTPGTDWPPALATSGKALARGYQFFYDLRSKCQQGCTRPPQWIASEQSPAA